ncbi:HlyD family efflux transporter periplasmic adaptor subunit [Treponema putidum]|uniref:HlyD family secretion protein n=1 Tax=Treponema putidum TaxID=221027 RepID=UPI0004F5DC73|nr:HlyD family efflux transporter periplasmic adaptor subunit [Treponema putidum]AIN93577.1 hypothetical protein JO40_05185 [Treponema putidum]TWI75458.1 multidrug resistance efflux pump [Treponema putidum]
MKQIVSVDELSYTSELLYGLKSKFEDRIIFIIGAFFVCLIFWLIFGQCEDVIRAYGIVRPSDDVSIVKIRRTGEVQKIFCKDGSIVKEGDVLLKLNTDADIKNEEDIVARLTLLLEKKRDNDLLLKSFYANKNHINPKYSQAYMRAKLFFEVRGNLKETLNLQKRYLNDTLKLPEASRTKEQVLTLKRNVKNAELNLSQYSENFLTSLLNEKETYEVEKNNLNANLSQVRLAINNATIYAPINETIFMQSSINKNDFLFANTTVLTIIPTAESGYYAYINVPASKAGKMATGMQVKMKFPAFPEYEFDKLNGVIETISPDAMNTGEHLIYIVKVKLNVTELKNKKGLSFPLKPGLQVDSTIILTEQSILSYLLKKLTE